MRKSAFFCFFVSSMIVIFFSLSIATADEVRLNGAATVADRVVTPLKNTVEKATGDKLIVVVNNAGKGLIDLVEGRCDASMSSASLETTVQAAKTAGKEVDIAKLKMHVLKSDEIAFIVNSANTVAGLTLEQVKDIHTGKIKNWQEVGGKDLPIVVVTDSLTSATRGFIKQAVLGGSEYVQNAVVLDNINKMNDAIANTPGGIGGIGKGFVDMNKVKIIKSGTVNRPLGLITIGDPSKKVQRVIEAYKAAAQK